MKKKSFSDFLILSQADLYWFEIPSNKFSLIEEVRIVLPMPGSVAEMIFAFFDEI